MNTIIMKIDSDLSVTSVMHALDELNRLEGSALRRQVDFIELQFAPTAEELDGALKVATELLKVGVGVMLRVYWGFAGTHGWAIQTERTRVVNEGGK